MREMKKTTVIILALFVSFACVVNAQKVRVAAAANLRYVLEDIKKQYEKEHPKTKVDITFGASGTLTQQILNGAAFDFFMAADMDFPNALKAKGATVGPVVTYIFGKVAMIVINEKDKEFVIETIIEAARSGEKGQFGDGKIFVTPVVETYTISSGKMEV